MHLAGAQRLAKGISIAYSVRHAGFSQAAREAHRACLACSATLVNVGLALATAGSVGAKTRRDEARRYFGSVATAKTSKIIGWKAQVQCALPLLCSGPIATEVRRLDTDTYLPRAAHALDLSPPPTLAEASCKGNAFPVCAHLPRGDHRKSIDYAIMKKAVCTPKLCR